MRIHPFQSQILIVVFLLSVPNERRRQLIMDTFLSGSDNTTSALGQLVKRLQEALAKTEEFDVLTALPSGGGRSMLKP